MVHAARLEQRPKQLRADQRHVPGEDEDLLDAGVEHVQGGTQRVARPARDVLERGVRPFGDGVADGLGGRRVDDERAGAGRRDTAASST